MGTNTEEAEDDCHALVIKFAELLGVERRAHNHYFEGIRDALPFGIGRAVPRFLYRLEVCDKQVGTKRAFVRFVDNDDTVAGKERVRKKLADEHTIRDIFYARLRARRLVKAYSVSDESTNAYVLFGGDARSKRRCRNSTRLGDRDHALARDSRLEEVLGYLCGVG